MTVMNKGHPIRGWPITAKAGVKPDRRRILGVRYIRAPGIMHRLPQGEPTKSLDLERVWKTLISNYIVHTGEGRAGPLV